MNTISEKVASTWFMKGLYVHTSMKANTQWRQTLIFIGGALNIFLKISPFSQIIGGAKSILIL